MTSTVKTIHAPDEIAFAPKFGTSYCIDARQYSIIYPDSEEGPELITKEFLMALDPKESSYLLDISNLAFKKKVAIIGMTDLFSYNPIFSTPEGHVVKINCEESAKLNNCGTRKRFSVATDLFTGKKYASLLMEILVKDDFKRIQAELETSQLLGNSAAKVWLTFHYKLTYLDKPREYYRFITELCDVGTINNLNYTAKLARSVFLQLLNALAKLEIHRKIHREIKPNNIVVMKIEGPVKTGEGESKEAAEATYSVKLIDFSDSCDESDIEARNSHRTTPHYASPKYAMAMLTEKENPKKQLMKAVTNKLDVWQVALCMVELYTTTLKGKTVWQLTFNGDFELIKKYKITHMAKKIKAVKEYDLLAGELLESMLVAKDSKRPKASELLAKFNEMAKDSKYQL